MNEKDLKKNKEKILLAMLNNVPFDGWSWQALYNGAEDLKIFSTEIREDEKIKLKSIFEFDLVNIVNEFNNYLDEKMKKKFLKEENNDLRTPERIKKLILLRLQFTKNFKESIRVSLSFMSLPNNAKRSINMLYRTCDKIWRVSGDRSTDFSFYTKRLILSGVYSSTLLYWINDDSKDSKGTEKFLDRRLNDVSKIGKLKNPNTFLKNRKLNNSKQPFELFSQISKSIYKSSNFRKLINRFKYF